jgi:predicted transcriptional regulator
MKMTRKNEWIADTQMFQRIAGTPESSYEDLSKEFDRIVHRKTQKEVDVAVNNNKAHLTITKVARNIV